MKVKYKILKRGRGKKIINLIKSSFYISKVCKVGEILTVDFQFTMIILCLQTKRILKDIEH